MGICVHRRILDVMPSTLLNVLMFKVTDTSVYLEMYIDLRDFFFFFFFLV